MNTAHARALRAFARKLAIVLVFRRAMIWATAWLFALGVVIIAARVSGVQPSGWLAFGGLGVVPVVIGAAAYQVCRSPSFSVIRANYDRLNSCGGVIMAEETADMTEWQARLGDARVPGLRWRFGRPLAVFGLGVLFVGVALMLPEGLTRTGAARPLEIGRLVEELQAEVEALKQEKIIEQNKALELQRQLARLQDESSGHDTHKTWEALDHIKQSNADAARQAAEEALSKIASLTQAEALAAALQKAMETGLSATAAKMATFDLAAMLKAAGLEDGLLKSELPTDLLSGLDGLSPADLEKLLSLIQSTKCTFSNAVARLANLKLVDANLLSKCQNAGQCPNTDALAAFLCQNTNGCGSYKELVALYSRGGIDRGRGDAPMTWTDGTEEEGAKFKEQTLPASVRMDEAQLVGISWAAPVESGENVAAGHGALDSATAGGGLGHASVILPRHRQAVQRYFERD